MTDAKQYLCSHLVMLVWNGHHATANLEKIWATGATLNAEEAIPPGSALHLECPEFRIHAHVTKCTLEEDGHLIDVDFPPGYEWTPERFQPKHMTDPDILLVRKLLSEISPQ